MQCATCDNDNPPQARFCARCGTALAEIAAAASTPPTPTSPSPLAPAPLAQADQAAPAPAVEYVGFWLRFLAFAIDAFVLGLVAWAASIAYDEFVYPWSDDWMGAVALLLRRISLLIYFWLFTGLKGQTPGKMVTGIMVVDERDKVPGLGRAALRELLGKPISAIVLLIGILWIAWDPGKQGWHDKMATTYVVRKGQRL